MEATWIVIAWLVGVSAVGALAVGSLLVWVFWGFRSSDIEVWSSDDDEEFF
jgi:hypothetical protein